MFRLTRRRKASKDRSSIGNVLIDLGYCDETSLHEALTRQLDSTPLLGELMVECGIITREQLEHALLRQRVLRGQEDPSELKRYGAESRRQALTNAAKRFKSIATSAGILAQKARG